MARPKIDEWEKIYLWQKTARRFRLISRLTGQSMIQVADIASQKMAENYKEQIAIFEMISKEAQGNGQEN